MENIPRNSVCSGWNCPLCVLTPLEIRYWGVKDSYHSRVTPGRSCFQRVSFTLFPGSRSDAAAASRWQNCSPSPCLSCWFSSGCWRDTGCSWTVCSKSVCRTECKEVVLFISSVFICREWCVLIRLSMLCYCLLSSRHGSLCGHDCIRKAA